jgi:hypothetical protein
LFCENYFILKFKQMKKLIQKATMVALLSLPLINFGQAPNLGTSVNFVLFSTNGAVTNSGISHLTGHVGTNNGSSTGFGNVNGVMNDQNGVSAQCASDLLIAYNQLNATVATFFPASLLGNGQVLNAGVYSIGAATTLNLDLILDGQSNPNAVFIFKIGGPFSANASSKVKLINGAQACNVFWKIEGLVSVASGSHLKGTIIANNAAINMNTGDTLEGRALSTTGAVTTNGVFAYTPIGCGSPTLTGPAAPNLGGAACYGLFSGNGAVSNSGITYVTGDVGTNVGLATGFNTLNVTGKVHPIPDGSTAQCASDLLVAYNYINTLPYDIELLYPAQFGQNLVLTPHTYLLNAATVLTDSLYLNAQGNVNAVFVIKINGALTTSTYAMVKLINGTQSKNVYWKIEGAVSISGNSVIRGTIISNNGALSSTSTGVLIDGRLLTTNGALSTSASTVTAFSIPSYCATLRIEELALENNNVSIYPNPFNSRINIIINKASQIKNADIMIYNTLGEVVWNTTISNDLTTIETNIFKAGIYYYRVTSAGKAIQSGRMVSQ